VDGFDLHYDGDYDEPGLDPEAPYHENHMAADALERTFIVFTGESWREYEAAIEEL